MSTERNIAHLQRLKVLEQDISDLKVKERAVFKNQLEDLSKSFINLSQALDQPNLTLEKSKPLEKSYNAVFKMLESTVPKSTKNSQVSKSMVKSRRPNDVEDELNKLIMQEIEQESQLNAACQMLNTFDKQYERLAKKDKLQINQYNMLQTQLHKAEEIGILTEQINNDQTKFKGNFEVMEVEDLFDCEVEIK
ncbi:Hypothetical_protein [Hexamita inflata]|uniref:Hypothetical_protein n=1 Tax=Hexamita inflata TaxID=28002 RepID=A0AA86RQA7_9EUKA|nr:Hypothetical protein HINF_LOCUS63714 [Hexamita inflata]